MTFKFSAAFPVVILLGSIKMIQVKVLFVHSTDKVKLVVLRAVLLTPREYSVVVGHKGTFRAPG
jgi:hypothetical protein